MNTSQIPIPKDYLERVYAGVLGKIIGVYLGRPFEGWDHEKILRSLGEITHYVHDKLNVPLVVADDDISGTFTFIRAVEDAGGIPTVKQVAQNWLNYIIENKTILWWGGMGMSTEHTAYLRLKNGIEAPRCGSIAMNGKTVAEQIGAQIFIDGCGMIAPGDPALAVDLARRFASVSHDGEAIYGAQVIAAMEAQAFVERDINKLIHTATGFIPRDCVINTLIRDLLAVREKESDWKRAFQFLKQNYGYDKFGGNCHIVPNHGVIILALLYGDGDFSKSLMIANTCGWDTDCNSGNVGCLLGIRNGLDGIERRWRDPVADRMYLPTADGGSCITDAATQALKLVQMGRLIRGEPFAKIKDGARFHFWFHGSLQGFVAEHGDVSNVNHRLAFQTKDGVARVSTATFIPPDAAKMGGYGVVASPTLYPGNEVQADLLANGAAAVTLFIRHYDESDKLVRVDLGSCEIKSSAKRTLSAIVPDTAGQPIADIGLEVQTKGDVFLDRLTWSDTPTVTLGKPPGGEIWKRAWVPGAWAINSWGYEHPQTRNLVVIQNEGRGLAIQGTRDWRDYRVEVVGSPHMAKAFGFAARVRGMRRYYALILSADGKARFVKMLDDQTVLSESPIKWENGSAYALALEVKGNHIEAKLNGRSIFETLDDSLESGAIGLICEEGRVGFGDVTVTAI